MLTPQHLQLIFIKPECTCTSSGPDRRGCGVRTHPLLRAALRLLRKLPDSEGAPVWESASDSESEPPSMSESTSRSDMCLLEDRTEATVSPGCSSFVVPIVPIPIVGMPILPRYVKPKRGECCTWAWPGAFPTWAWPGRMFATCAPWAWPEF